MKFNHSIFVLFFYFWNCIIVDEWPAQPSKIAVPGSQTTATIQNLRPAQVYYIRILAENRLGLSEPSEVVQVSTLEEGKLTPSTSGDPISWKTQ